MAAITICSDFEPPKIKSATVSTVSPSICHEGMGPDAMILVFWMLSFKPTFSLSSFTFIKRLFSSSSLSSILYICTPELFIWVLLKRCHKGLMKIIFELIIRKLNKQSCDLPICFISIRIMNQELLCISVILIWSNSKYKMITCNDVSQPFHVDIF